MAVVKFVNLKNFDAFEVARIKTLTIRYMEKLERDLPPLFSMVLRGKKYEKEGSRVKYDFHVRLERPILTSHAADWDLSRALHRVMQKLEREIQKKFKTEGQKQGKIHVKESRKRRR